MKKLYKSLCFIGLVLLFINTNNNLNHKLEVKASATKPMTEQAVEINTTSNPVLLTDSTIVSDDVDELYPPDNIVVSNITATSATVTFSPNINIPNVRIYVNRWSDNVSEQIYTTTTNSANIVLQPSTRYYIKLVTIGSSGVASYPSYSSLFNSLEDLIYPVQASEIKVYLSEPTTISVDYTTGMDAVQTEVMLYLPDGSLVSMLSGLTTGSSYVNFNGLTANTLYYVVVQGISKTSNITRSNQYSITTNAIAK